MQCLRVPPNAAESTAERLRRLHQNKPQGPRTHRSVWTTVFRALVGWRFKLGQLHLAQAPGRKRHCFCRALPRFRQGATEEAPYISGIYNCFASFCNILGPVLRKAEAMPCRIKRRNLRVLRRNLRD